LWVTGSITKIYVTNSNDLHTLNAITMH